MIIKEEFADIATPTGPANLTLESASHPLPAVSKTQ
jgi:hypothetical protein